MWGVISLDDRVRDDVTGGGGTQPNQMISLEDRVGGGGGGGLNRCRWRRRGRCSWWTNEEKGRVHMMKSLGAQSELCARKMKGLNCMKRRALNQTTSRGESQLKDFLGREGSISLLCNWRRS